MSKRNQASLMHIAPSTLRSAMFSIFGISARDSTQVCLQDLHADWPETGLRQSDFPVALNELTTHRFATLAVRGADTVVQLTDSGLAEFHRPSLPLKQRIHDWWVLSRLRLRRIDFSITQPRARRRRRNDAIAVPRIENR